MGIFDKSKSVSAQIEELNLNVDALKKALGEKETLLMEKEKLVVERDAQIKELNEEVAELESQLEQQTAVNQEEVARLAAEKAQAQISSIGITPVQAEEVEANPTPKNPWDEYYALPSDKRHAYWKENTQKLLSTARQ